MLSLLNGLSDGTVDIKEVGVAAKVCEGIQSGVHLELEYAKALGREPNIPFLGNCFGSYTIQTMRAKKNVIEMPPSQETLMSDKIED